jgi:hypothetical protein
MRLSASPVGRKLVRFGQTRGIEEPLSQRLLALVDRTRADRHHSPSAGTAQCCPDPLSDDLLIGRLGHEKRPEGGKLGTRANAVVVRPTARPIVLPVSAQRDRHGSANRRGIAPCAQRHLGLGNKRSPVSHEETIRQRATSQTGHILGTWRILMPWVETQIRHVGWRII